MNPVNVSSRLFSLLILISILWGCTGSKETTLSPIEKGRLIVVDQSDNGFVLRGSRSLIKYDFRNHPTARYDFDLTVHDMGLSTDLRLYAFNTDFQKFYILDKYLNLITEYNFNDYFSFLVRHPVLANGQNIWLYNQTEHKLQEYSAQLEFRTESRNLNWEIPNVRVDQLIFHQNEIYLIDHSRGVFIFDYAGRLRQRISMPPVSRDIQIDHTMSRIFAFVSGAWHVIDPDLPNPTLQPLNLPAMETLQDTDQLIFQNAKIYHWNTDMQQMEISENRYLLHD